MSMAISGDLERLGAEKVASGHYSSPDEVVREALSLLDERDGAGTGDLEELRAMIRVGDEPAERGELVDGPTAFEAIRRKIRSRIESAHEPCSADQGGRARPRRY